MTDLPTPPTKADLRRTALAARDRLDASAREAAARRLAAEADAVAGSIVAGYFPIRSEIDPRPLMARLEARGARLCLPAVEADGETLSFRAWSLGAPLEPAAFGLSVPPAEAERLDPDVLLMPLAAFDDRGERIGYGKGHYDRALARLERDRPVVKIGLAFACQRVEAVPAEPHDRRLDLVLTEAGPLVPRPPRPPEPME